MKKPKADVNANFHFLYKSEGAPATRIFKDYRMKWKENPEKYIAGKFPLHLDIESTSLCNLKCPFCSFLTVHKSWKRGSMDWGLYKKIIDEGRDNSLYSIKLSLRGEPLIHPRIIDMVKYAKKNNVIDIYFNTNAMLLDEEMSGRIIDSGMNRISISFEGTTKEVYERNRIGAKYDIVIKNIEMLVRLKQLRKVNNPRIRIQTVLIPGMNKILNEYKKFWKNIGVDEIGYLDLEQDPLPNENLSHPWVCPQLWQRMTIWYDGTIIPCVHDTFGMMKFGNVKDLKISDLWKSKMEETYRAIHKNGKGELLYSCRVCPLRTGQVRKLKK